MSSLKADFTVFTFSKLFLVMCSIFSFWKNVSKHLTQAPTYLCWHPDDASRIDLPTYADGWPSADVSIIYMFTMFSTFALYLLIFIFEKYQLASGSGTYLPLLTPRWHFWLEHTYLSSDYWMVMISNSPVTSVIPFHCSVQSSWTTRRISEPGNLGRSTLSRDRNQEV